MLWQRLLMIPNIQVLLYMSQIPLLSCLGHVTKIFPVRSEQRWGKPPLDLTPENICDSPSLSPFPCDIGGPSLRWHHCKGKTTWILPGLLLRRECPRELSNPIRLSVSENKLINICWGFRICLLPQHRLSQRFLKCDLYTSSMSITWEVIWNAHPWAHLRLFESETLRMGHSYLGFKTLQVILMNTKVWEALV